MRAAAPDLIQSRQLYGPACPAAVNGFKFAEKTINHACLAAIERFLFVDALDRIRKHG
jgi:hypothetical protein